MPATPCPENPRRRPGRAPSLLMGEQRPHRVTDPAPGPRDGLSKTHSRRVPTDHARCDLSDARGAPGPSGSTTAASVRPGHAQAAQNRPDRQRREPAAAHVASSAPPAPRQSPAMPGCPTVGHRAGHPAESFVPLIPFSCATLLSQIITLDHRLSSLELTRTGCLVAGVSLNITNDELGPLGGVHVREPKIG